MHKKEYIPRRKPLGFDTSSLMWLCQGNPGALACLTELYHRHAADPFRVEQVLIMFDDLGLRGSRLYVLWNDGLDRNTDRLMILATMRYSGEVTDEWIMKHLEGVRGTPIEYGELGGED